MSYLIDKFKGTYRIKCPYDSITHQFPKKLDGTFEDCDLYIDCQHGNQVFNYGHGTLQAYIPSKKRGRNILNQIDDSLVFGIEENDSEILFKFKYRDWEQIIPLLSPRTSGASMSPFSTRNLPKNKSYQIPDGQLEEYKDAIVRIPQNQVLGITHTTKKFMKSLASKKHPWEEIKADMAQKGLKGKEYIHSIGKWDDYIKYLKKDLNY